jgi:hypothetical protein
MSAMVPQPQAARAKRFTPTKNRRNLGVAWLVVAAASIGFAIQVRYGEFDPRAIAWLSVGVIAAGLAIWTKPGSRRIVMVLIFAALAMQFWRLFTRSPSIVRFKHSEYILCAAGLLLAAACVVGLIGKATRSCAFGGILAMHFILGVLVICIYPNPIVDVFLYEQGAATALVHGQDPYAVRFPDVYAHSATSHYGPGVSVNGWLQYGYPYPPVPMLMAAPGLIAGDFRYAYLLAVTAAGVLIATMRGGIRPLRGGVALDGIAVGAATLLLFLPSQFLVMQIGWTEPTAVLLLAATVWIALRHPRWLAIPLGLLLVCKQYMIFAVPAVWLLMPAIPAGKRRRIAVETIIVAVAVSLPFAIIGGPRFWQSVVGFHFRQSFRYDALNYLVLLTHSFPALTLWPRFEQIGPAVGIVAAAGMVALCLRRLPRTPAGFSAAIGLILLAFFIFNKQAFCNYYYFIIAAFCTAIAASNAKEELNRRDTETQRSDRGTVDLGMRRPPQKAG